MAIFTPYEISRDINGFHSTGIETIIPFSSFCYNFLMNADDTVELEVPPVIGTQGSESYKKMVAQFSFTPGKTVYVWDTGQALALPVSDTPISNVMMLNPRNRVALPGATLKFITPDTDVYAQVCFYPFKG